MNLGRLPVQDRCGSCGAPVAWARTATGRGLMVDLDPRPDGNLELTVDEHRRRWAAITRKATTTTTLRYVAHFATCPNADQHRRRFRPTPPPPVTLF